AMVRRVCRTIQKWGLEDGYFASAYDARVFGDDLEHLCLNQFAAFNSPVWFNVGLSDVYGIVGPPNGWRWDPAASQTVRVQDAYRNPQAAACFIQSVQDDMEAICNLATSEMMLFKYGSGTGTDLTPLRSTREKLSGGGKPSGPVSFMRVYDAGASVVKSGGKTRRAAKMQTLKVWHPDILEFIECKAKEERKARALLEAGYSDGMTGSADEAYSSVAYQNANLSVRVTDDFMRRAALGQIREFINPRPEEQDILVPLVAPSTGETIANLPAHEVLTKIASAAWECGDPGLQYEDTIQHWHTCPNTAPINSSNPCSEFMFIDDSACNLASINLMKFRRQDGTFDDARFRVAVRIVIIAQEILVDRASYPTEKIALNSHRFRPLGLGYANLGAYLMSLGLPYDSDAGRSLAAAITSIMHGEAYLTSACIARQIGAFEGHADNREPMMRVIQQHRSASRELLEKHRGSSATSESERLAILAAGIWDAARKRGERHGYRNSQVTVLAPTGTIAFMMGCDTTGVEPETALVKHKSLAGGGVIKIVNRTVGMALRTLGYDPEKVEKIEAWISEQGSPEDCPDLKYEHLAVFDCAIPTRQGGRSIDWKGHVRMMAAVQPFLSGAISKTVNMPADSTTEDIRDVFQMGWREGLKAIAVYRDGSKGQQPLKVATRTDRKTDQTDAIVNAFDSTRSAWYIGVDLAVDPDAPIRKEADGRPIGTLRELASLANLSGQLKRERLPETRRSMTHKFDVQGHEGYVTVGFYADGRPGEMFIRMAKEGSTVGGLMDSLAMSISLGLQYGVPIDVFVNKYTGTR
ncbi:MAG: vitamin B12-dependent ribonucleotide reductase, partial [Patescibacteria group bacterium]|nr:vitamin B12-dependent ribonucleotide reductase [Patescibacteria group bacterium]